MLQVAKDRVALPLENPGKADAPASSSQTRGKEDWAWRAKHQPLNEVFDMVSGAHATSLAPLLTANGHLVCI